MNTLATHHIRFNRSAGLPLKFHATKIALQYAEGSMSADEYREIYLSLTDTGKEVADSVIASIESEEFGK